MPNKRKQAKLIAKPSMKMTTLGMGFLLLVILAVAYYLFSSSTTSYLVYENSTSQKPKVLNAEVLTRWSYYPVSNVSFNYSVQIKNLDNFDWNEIKVVLNDIYVCRNLTTTLKSSEIFSVLNRECFDDENNPLADVNQSKILIATKEGSAIHT